MKKLSFFKPILLAAVACAAVACEEDDVYVGSVDTDRLNGSTTEGGTNGNADGNMVYITDQDGKLNVSNVDFRDNATYSLNINAVKPISADCNVTLTIDPEVLTAYNAANGTEYAAIPASWVSFENDGVATIKAGESKTTIAYTITSDGSLDANATYALPFRMNFGGRYADATHMVLVKDITALADCHKTYVDATGAVKPGIKIFSVMEVNDTNPLNNLRYTLKNSGKYMVDALVMFSGNINYNIETGKVYFHANENIQAILDNRDKYLKPLKDRGMKVIMGVMCNHDRACISNLNDETARLFAKELKALCDAYDLDGIFWDDEYCSPIYPAPPGFVDRSNAAFSRLAYEVWKIQPERWNIAYGYSNTSYAQEVDGVQPGTFISYCLPDYSSYYYDSTDGYPGMTLSQMGGCSMEFAQGRWGASEETLRNMRDAGYGAMMVFAMDPFRANASGQDSAMGRLAKGFYNDEVVVDPTTYAKDW